MDTSATNSTNGFVRPPELDNYFSGTIASLDAVAFVNSIIKSSVQLGASDIFFEPQPSHLRVRARVDGVLFEFGFIAMEVYDRVSSRIKVLASLDPSEKRKIQEGQITYNTEGKSINLRVEISQTINGELIVLRIHEKNTIILDLAHLGFNKPTYEAYSKVIKSRSGLIIVCGPTGCGKTTTLYSSIMSLNENYAYNVLTIEDPVEYQLEGANQMQVQKSTEFTFAEGLKTILRLSPDIILVGEIRDKETAKIAVESGLTGQLVVSSLHAEDSIGGLFRMLDLGIESYLLNSALTGIIAQRLVRNLCQTCKTPTEITATDKDLFKKILGREPKSLFKSVGCDACNKLGFKGRIGIFELLTITPEIRNMLRDKINETEIRDTLAKRGFISLLRDGLEKSELGITTVGEVIRNGLRSF